MITWMHAAWLAVGLVLGVIHATWIWRSARQPTAATVVMGSVRLMTVGLVLATAAIWGEILSAAMGWAFGLIAGVSVVMASRSRICQRRASP